MSVSKTASGVEVTRVAPEHHGALAAFYRRVWDPNASLASVRAGRDEAARANPITPGGPPPTWVVLQNGEAIAHVTTIPIRLWLNGTTCGAYWMKGLWVLPEHQRSSAGFLVLRAAVNELAEPALALVHEPAAIRLFQALKFSDLGGLPNRLRVLNPRSVLERLDVSALGLDRLPGWARAAARHARVMAPVLGPLAGVAGAAWAAMGSGSLHGATIATNLPLDRAAVDRLWLDARDELRAGPTRGASEIAARYGVDAGYEFVEVRSGGEMIGLGIVKHPGKDGDPRLHGIRIATLSDLLFRPTDTRAGLAIVRGAERVARSLGADALLCSASAAAIDSILRRRGYLSLPPNLRVLLRSRPGDGPPSLPHIGSWWFTRGDSGGDGTF